MGRLQSEELLNEPSHKFSRLTITQLPSTHLPPMLQSWPLVRLDGMTWWSCARCLAEMCLNTLQATTGKQLIPSTKKITDRSGCPCIRRGFERQLRSWLAWHLRREQLKKEYSGNKRKQTSLEELAAMQLQVAASAALRTK